MYLHFSRTILSLHGFIHLVNLCDYVDNYWIRRFSAGEGDRAGRSWGSWKSSTIFQNRCWRWHGNWLVWTERGFGSSLKTRYENDKLLHIRSLITFIFLLWWFYECSHIFSWNKFGWFCVLWFFPIYKNSALHEYILIGCLLYKKIILIFFEFISTRDWCRNFFFCRVWWRNQIITNLMLFR